MTLPDALNGKRLPNWVYFVALGILLGIQGATIVYGQNGAIERLAEEQRTSTDRLVKAINRVAERDSVNNYQVRDIVDRRTREANQEFKEVGKLIRGYVPRSIE